MIPKKVQRIDDASLQVEWDDNHRGRHLFRTLRKYCPCASCKTELESKEGTVMLPVLTPGQYELRSIQPVGNYALQLTWGDGHQTGIYTFDYLRQLCECEECLQTTAE